LTTSKNWSDFIEHTIQNNKPITPDFGGQLFWPKMGRVNGFSNQVWKSLNQPSTKDLNPSKKVRKKFGQGYFFKQIKP
jgi:hypothetical protein